MLAVNMPSLYIVFLNFLSFLSRLGTYLRQSFLPQHCQSRSARAVCKPPKKVQELVDSVSVEGKELLSICTYGRSRIAFESWRKTEFPQLKGAVYLDHAGATLYSRSQVKLVTEELGDQLFGNPHSQSDGNTNSSTVIEEARMRVLAFCKTSSADYTCVFTPGATGALKLLGEVFPWTSESEFAYSAENHNSVLGIREYALEKGATAYAVDVESNLSEDASLGGMSKWSLVKRKRLTRTRVKPKEGQSSEGNEQQSVKETYSLFGCPAECNFSGARIDLALVGEIQKGSLSEGRGHWKVLLDAAKACGTSPPDLSVYPADFVAVSFYKIFGYPTGLGALLIRNDSASILQKRYFSGGTVAVSIADKDYVKRRERLEEWLEDGTASFLGVAALRHGFDTVEKLGMENIRRHTAALTQFTARQLLNLRHSNGRNACVLYGNHDSDDGQNQGPVIAFNLMRPDGSWVGYKEVEKLAGLRNIQLRTGCFCNPGACAKYLGLTSKEMEANYEAGHTCWDDQDLIDGRPTGAVRISFGYMSTVDDAHAFLSLVRDFFVVSEPPAIRSGVRTEGRATQGAVDRRPPPTLEKIIVYPIKSCGGCAPEAWPIGPNGLLYDREWLLVDAAGNGLTQKKVPALCTLQASVDLEAGQLQVTSPSMSEALTVELHSRPGTRLAGTVQVCGNRPGADAYGPDVSSWCSDALGLPCTLVRQQPRSRTVHRNSVQKAQSVRTATVDVDTVSKAVRITQATGASQVTKTAAARKDAPVQTFRIGLVESGLSSGVRSEEGFESIESSLGFANEGQFLLVNQASVDDLNRRIEEAGSRPRAGVSSREGLRVLEAEQFRPNLVVRGLEPFEEDTWQGMQIGGQDFSVIGGCSRCSMITVDQKTGERGGNEPLLALASFRRNKGKLLFGILLNHEPGSAVEFGTTESGAVSEHRRWLRKRWPNLLECASNLLAE